MKKILTASLFLLLNATFLYAKPGDNTAAFLRIGVGAKPSAMAGAYSGVKGDLISLYYNPAGPASSSGYKFSFSHAFWLDSIDYANFTAGAPVFDGYMALGLCGLFYGEIDKYDRKGDFVGRSYSPSDMSATFSYSREFEEMHAGASVKFIRSRIAGYRANAAGFDIGVAREFSMLTAGISIQNIGTRMKFRNKSYPLPRTVRMGASYPFSFSEIEMLAVSELNFSSEVPFQINTGLNADYSYEDFIFSLRLGLTSYAQGLDGWSHLSAGFGIEYSNIVFDYAFSPYEDLGITHRISIGYRLERERLDHRDYPEGLPGEKGGNDTF